MSSTCNARWTDGVRYLHTSGSGHALVTDAMPPFGGGSAPTPMELILHALAGCTGVDLAMMLEKMHQPVQGIEITVEGDRAEDHPKVYTHLRVHVRVTGAVDERKLERALALSSETYCSVSAMLAATVKISHTHEIVIPE
jgi:putative redox protein